MKLSTIGLWGLVWAGIAARGWAATGIAYLKGTADNSPIKGTVRFEDTASGLKINAQVVNVSPGAHGFHIHEFGSCEELGKAAGNHYNPMNAPHGHILKDGSKKAHAGDMGNITVGANGEATLEIVIPGVTLANGPKSVGGRSVILHEKVDDFSQPLGNAGGRIGCGIIVITGN